MWRGAGTSDISSIAAINLSHRHINIIRSKGKKMLNRIPPNKQLKRTNHLLSHHIVSTKKVVFSPPILKTLSGDHYSTSPSPHKMQSMSPHRYKTKKTLSKLFRKAREAEHGQTYLAKSKTTIQNDPSSAKITIYREKQISKEKRQGKLTIVRAFSICVNGAPTLSEIILRFEDVFGNTLPKITEISDDILQIHSKMEQTPNEVVVNDS